MAEKEFKGRIVHKHDTEINWNKATKFIPKQSELIVYDKDDNYDYERLKIGDGVTTVTNLPFYGGSIENILDGIATGSVRTSMSTAESTDYSLGNSSFAEGNLTKAGGNFSHAEGYKSNASGAYSHAEGRETTASGSVSHAEGTSTVASGIRSHSSGYGTIANGENQTAIGKYNVQDNSNEFAFIIGNGTSAARSNAFTVDWSGNIKANGKALATEEYVNANGGKIDTISINGSAQEIVDKNVNITIPTKTSDLTNDSNFLSSIPSEYITEEELNLKNYQNDTEVQNKINTEINKLNKNDNAIVGQYVSSVSEENGIIAVSRENLPEQIDYTVTITESTSEGFAKVYNIKQISTGLNATINIPKDMVVSSGKVETYTLSGEWGLAGTYLVLTLANATNDKVYINVGNLIEYVTSGSTINDQIQINIDNEHKVTATLKDGSITKTQLDTNLQNELDSKVDAEYVQENGGKINSISVDGTTQTIDANKNVNIVLSGKVDKVSGKQLSTEDYTTAEKNKLAGIANEATKTIISTITIPRGRMRGDVDGDGKLTQADVDLLSAYVFDPSTIPLDDTQLLCADVRGDNNINGTDILWLRQCLTNTRKPGSCGPEVTGNWTNNSNYETEDGQFYTDILITGITANHSASVIVKGTFESGFFTKAECIEGAIRIYAKLCPISDATAIVIWGEGNGNASITVENENLAIYNDHISNTDIHVTLDEKAVWNEKEVFIATYDTTTNEEMEAALDAGKIVFVNINNKFFIPLMYRFGSTHIFVQLKPRDNGSTVDQAIMVECSNNIWSSTPIQIIPLVTTSDKGKVLMVNESGSWAATNLPQAGAKIQMITWEETD